MKNTFPHRKWRSTSVAPELEFRYSNECLVLLSNPSPTDNDK